MSCPLVGVAGSIAGNSRAVEVFLIPRFSNPSDILMRWSGIHIGEPLHFSRLATGLTTLVFAGQAVETWLQNRPMDAFEFGIATGIAAVATIVAHRDIRRDQKQFKS
jgi:hypothetical protein